MTVECDSLNLVCCQMSRCRLLVEGLLQYGTRIARLRLLLELRIFWCETSMKVVRLARVGRDFQWRHHHSIGNITQFWTTPSANPAKTHRDFGGSTTDGMPRENVCAVKGVLEVLEYAGANVPSCVVMATTTTQSSTLRDMVWILPGDTFCWSFHHQSSRENYSKGTHLTSNQHLIANTTDTALLA